MTNIAKLLRALLAPSQDLENALQQLLTERGIDNAVGAQFDILGSVAGQPRNGLDDDTYRRYVRARIMVHRSSGNIEDVLRVADLFVYDDDAVYVVDNQGAAAYVLRVNGIALPDATAALLAQFLQTASSAGVRVIVEYSAEDPSTWFQWDTVDLGWDDGAFRDAI